MILSLFQLGDAQNHFIEDTCCKECRVRAKSPSNVAMGSRNEIIYFSWIVHQPSYAPKVNEAASRVWWVKWSCSDVQAHYRALDDYTPLWSLWQGTPIRLRSMVMQKKWSNNKIDDKMQINGCGSESENRESEFIKDVHNYCRNDSATKNQFVMKNSTKAHLSDNIDNCSQKNVERTIPGSVMYNRKAKEIRVHCRDGWVTFQHVMLKGRKLMTAQDFYNGFMSKVSKDLHRFT
ncbi:Methionyl-tRNA formyltransferase, mitochondrial [Portunus trituberculatus]|uniref:Methionyl-tRNA formyltransferase, mitochondrial n=1 Tax=Portunus trituberculatus TaxID=210409 RepID=A0A5B7H5L2_PORTR|nr:Methionyl-tRNA formyltransferase, mitochondrial [Portunus trituberculatus]